jgi:hypothetical protein
MSLEIYVRAKVTVRAKWARVNSVFLVQLRKKMARDFRGSTQTKQRLRDARFHRWMVGILARTQYRRKNLVEWAAGMSTGRAQEMQKDSGQRAAASGQLSVLSCQFSVLSSQFAPS